MIYSYLDVQVIGQKVACLNSKEYDFLMASKSFQSDQRVLLIPLNNLDISMRSLKLFANLCKDFRVVVLDPSDKDSLLLDFLVTHHLSQLSV